MKRYGIVHPLVLSFYSPSLYRDVAEHWTGVGFLYLLLLLALSWVPPILRFHHSTAALLETLGPAVLEQVPTISIRHGEVSIQESQPYVITVPGSDTPLMVVDTSGQITPENSQAFVLLMKHQVVVRRNPHETRTYDLSGVQDLTVDRATVERLLNAGKRWLAVLAYPVALTASYIYRILQALLYAAVGILFANLFRASLEYAVLLRLTCIALTPAVVADTVRGILDLDSGLAWWSGCLLISMGYLLFAVRANSPVEPAQSEPLSGASPG